MVDSDVAFEARTGFGFGIGVGIEVDVGCDVDCITGLGVDVVVVSVFRLIVLVDGGAVEGGSAVEVVGAVSPSCCEIFGGSDLKANFASLP